MFINPKKVLISLTVSSTLLSPMLMAEDEMIKSIMELRSDVESLYTKVDDGKEAYKSQMKSYALQISDNEAQINRQETSLKLLGQSITKAEKKLDEMGSASVNLKPIVKDAIESMKKEIQVGIPFKIKERIAVLDKIAEDMEQENITQEKALALTWASYDDTLRLTKEIGQFKQEIILDEKATIAKIAKIGSVMMFFSTPDNRVGYVSQSGNKFNYEVTNDEDERNQIIDLFDSLHKQIRTGYFTLPNALLLRGVN